MPPLSRVKLTALNFFRFHHIWTNLKLKTEYKIDRIIGWAHPALLTLLRYEKITLFLDGTFRCVPRKFKQCVVAMVYDRGSKLYAPVFYALAASKTYDSYWNILQYISDACGQRISPSQVVCDFESSLIQAVRDWFPGIDIVGCFLHLKKACFRKMVKLNIPAAEAMIAMEKGLLDMLTVVEQAKAAKQGVAWVRARICQRCEEDGIVYSVAMWNAFWAYFAKTWIKLIPPQFWNVHGLRRDIVARTNNLLERFNRELNAVFGTPHPSVACFVQTIEEISRRYVKLREHITQGLADSPRRETQHDLPLPVDLPDVAEDDEGEALAGGDGSSIDEGSDDDSDDGEASAGGSDSEIDQFDDDDAEITL